MCNVSILRGRNAVFYAAGGPIATASGESATLLAGRAKASLEALSVADALNGRAVNEYLDRIAKEMGWDAK
jgi:hypothetical protein